MLGRFLEISVHCADLLESLRFYQRMGLRELSTGDVWKHPYAVVSDGRLVIGLHGYRFDSPALTFALPSLAGHLALFEELAIPLAFAKTGADQFNEAGFLTPGGQMVAMLEARTFSPPDFAERDFSLLGRFESLMLPGPDPQGEAVFWERLGLAREAERSTPFPAVTLGDGDISVTACTPQASARRALRFTCNDPGPLAMALDDAGIAWDSIVPGPAGGEAAIALESPEGLRLILETPSPSGA